MTQSELTARYGAVMMNAFGAPKPVFERGEGVHVGATVQLWGQVSEQICAYADQHVCDLIVLGTRGRSNFSKLLLGSVSTQVTSHAHCPVTLVR